MKRTSKAAIAIGAATMLMLSGVGSLAYWQDSVDSHAFSFQTGYLDMSGPYGNWELNGEAIEKTALEGKKIVPGSVIVYTKILKVYGGGHDLFMAADVELGGLTAVSKHYMEGDDPDYYPEKTPPVEPRYTLTGQEGMTVGWTADPHIYSVAFGDGRDYGEMLLTITLEWPEGGPESAKSDEVEAKLTMDKTGVTLRQVQEPLDTVPAG